MMSRNYIKPTKAEKERMDRLRLMGCICCHLAFGSYYPCEEIHHIVKGGKRLGHWFSLPLCRRHHQGKGGEWLWTSIADGSKVFARVFGTEIELWLKVQHALKLDDTLPISKVLPRRAA